MLFSDKYQPQHPRESRVNCTCNLSIWHCPKHCNLISGQDNHFRTVYCFYRRAKVFRLYLLLDSLQIVEYGAHRFCKGDKSVNSITWLLRSHYHIHSIHANITMFLLFIISSTLSYYVSIQGIHPSIRGEVWEFLLGCYDPKSTFDERDQIRARRR